MLVALLRVVDLEVELRGGAIASTPGRDAQGPFLVQVSNGLIQSTDLDQLASVLWKILMGTSSPGSLPSTTSSRSGTPFPTDVAHCTNVVSLHAVPSIGRQADRHRQFSPYTLLLIRSGEYCPIQSVPSCRSATFRENWR